MPADASRLPRVLFVIGSLDPGGSEGQLAELLARTHGTRIDAVVAMLSEPSDDRHVTRLTEAGVPLHVVGVGRTRPARVLGALRRLAGLMRSWRPDLVSPWLEQSALVAAPIARLLGVPVLLARRNVSGHYAERGRLVVAAIHRAERLAVLATANSRAVAAETVRRGIPPERVRVILNGYLGTGPAPLPSRDVVTLGYLARMRTEKGHHRLLRVLGELHSDVAWRARLGGDGPLEDEIEAEAERRGLTDRVEFAGAIDDVPAFWRDCDIAVLLSDHEGSPNALVEAAAMGRPLLATAVGGIPELVDDEVGALVDPDDSAAAASALARLVSDRALRERLGATAARRVEERYSMDAFVDGHCAAIREALELARS